MTPFRDLPIRRKVAVLIVATSAIALLLTSAAFMVFEWSTFRGAALSNLTTLSRIVAENSTAALRFNNEDDAREMLASLRAEKDIIAAALFDAQGRRIAAYATQQSQPPRTLTSVPTRGYVFTSTQLEVYEPIVQETRQFGTLFIRSSLAAMYRRFLLYGVIVLTILGTASLVAFALSSRLQQRITAPIQELARTAHAISEQGDYSRRASRYGNDELGALTDAFNRMLDEIKEREQRLSASEERLRVALGAADMGTWRYYPERRESMIDENYRRIYGLPAGNGTANAGELLSRIFPDDRERIRTALEQLIVDPTAQYALDYRVLAPDGKVRWVRDRGRVVRRADDSIDYITGALVDITERKQAEEEIYRLNRDLEQRVIERTAQLEQSNRELEAFTYSVSHDLRGPLRHMSGYAEIVHDDPASKLSDEARTCLGRISGAATRLSRLVDSLLNLGRVGRQELVLQRIRLDDLVTAALRELESETKNRRVEWHRQRLPIVDCDPSLMHIVFVNLISNALKYSRPRDVAIIHIGMQVENGETAVLVRDNGVGFDPRFQAKLFGVFERLHSATAFEGTGIGLATVDRIIKKHGGRIWAKSAVDEGATFFFTLQGM
jgi:signal transduction histidine kinase/HAMP domain-containing protein